MIDAASLDRLTPWTRQKVRALLRFAGSAGVDVARISSDWRSCEAQNALHAAGTSPQAGCRSWHAWGRAVDLYIPNYPIEDYAVLGERWEAMGGVWGGRFSYGDYNHFEWHPETDTVSTYCPTADSVCPMPPWADDRPLLARGSTWLGLGIAAAGIAVARQISR